MKGTIRELKSELKTAEDALVRERKKPPREVTVTKTVTVPDTRYQEKFKEQYVLRMRLEKENKWLWKLAIFLWVILVITAVLWAL